MEIERLMDKDDLVVVTGGGGFIGGHLVADLRRRGHKRIRVGRRQAVRRVVPVVPGRREPAGSICRTRTPATGAARDAGLVFNLAADMGGMGFIENNKAVCMLTVLINTHMLMAARKTASSASSTPRRRASTRRTSRRAPNVTPLKETDAYPAMPEDGYGWEKLFSERMCRHFREDFGLQTRVARYHNVYGPHGT